MQHLRVAAMYETSCYKMSDHNI